MHACTHARTQAVKALIGYGVLGNTSMNTRGAPIVNEAREVHIRARVRGAGR